MIQRFGLGYPLKPYIQNVNECMKSDIKPGCAQKCQSVTEVAKNMGYC